MKNTVNGESLLNWRGVFSEKPDLTLSKYAGARVVQAESTFRNFARMKGRIIFKLGKSGLAVAVALLTLSGCALAPLVIEKLVTVGVGVWGVSEHQDRKKEMEAIKERVEQIEQVKAVEDFPLP